MASNILLTGASGFLGSHILKELLQKKYNVVILKREESNLYRIENLKNFSVFTLKKDYSNFNELFTHFKIDTIIHLATEYGRNLSFSKVLEANVLLPIKLLEASNKTHLKLFVNTDSFFSKFSDYQYLQPYIKTKKIFLDYLKDIEDVKVINLQLEHIYGEFDSDSKFITSVMKQMINNVENIELSAGEQKRDFVYVADVVSAYMKILEKENELPFFETFEVGTGHSLSVREFVEKMYSTTKSESNLLFGKLTTRINEIQDSKANNLSLKNLGWNPIYTHKAALERILKLEN
ncbi:Nucleoside-diphosphate-sugar epimerase [Chryseobacterium piscicola]|jgi:nucleoside-diphosphate-sugar epimerase|uniref:Nucleoside-diphosphate-sugar epimerase n=1 Tax=Chryseobacterium piscicola TaxID=551459 RepID=A0A1N7NI07_9FLAO|nr:NAD-dependent epimerase/dehydratase [Chryseobacterium piscicola]PQA90539.1 hypothetical protein B0A70_14555 [Chryseobacterium piscicola]SIS97819.1 Nucleoside-diphosphate-sugar epimerase [Chryseobacterium piscicola]